MVEKINIKQILNKSSQHVTLKNLVVERVCYTIIVLHFQKSNFWRKTSFNVFGKTVVSKSKTEMVKSSQIEISIIPNNVESSQFND